MAKPGAKPPEAKPTTNAEARPVHVKCRQTGFEARIPAADWSAYTREQKAQYRIMEE